VAPSDDSAELEIELEQAPATELAQGLDPADEERRTLLKLGQPGGQQRVFMAYACLKQMLAHTQRNLDAEIGGILLGQVFLRQHCHDSLIAAEDLPQQNAADFRV